MKDTNERVIVVGGGIAGLTAAFRCKQAGLDVTVLEAADHVGGRMWTRRRDGFVIDTGAAALAKYPQMRALATDAGIAHQMVPCGDLVGIPRDGRIHHIGADLLKAASTGLLSTRAKLSLLRMGLDTLRLSRKFSWDDLGAVPGYNTETVEEYANRLTSGEVRDWLIDPVFRACYMGDIDVMPATEFTFLLVNLVGATPFTFADGVGALPAALAAQLDVRLDATVVDVSEGESSASVTWRDAAGREQTEVADAVVIALAAPAMAGIHPGLDPDDRRVVDSLDYTSLITVTLALDRAPSDPAMLVALPSGDHPDLTSLFLAHNKHPGRAPEGRGLVTVFWHHRWNVEHLQDSDDELIAAGHKAMLDVLPDAGDVMFGDVARWPQAIVRADRSTYGALHELGARRTRARRIHLAGDYFGGSTSNAALWSGEFAARQVIGHLSGGRP